VKLVSDRGLSLIKMYGRMEMEMADLSLEDQKEFNGGVRNKGSWQGKAHNGRPIRCSGLIFLFHHWTVMRCAPGRYPQGSTAIGCSGDCAIPIWQEVSYEPRVMHFNDL